MKYLKRCVFSFSLLSFLSLSGLDIGIQIANGECITLNFEETDCVIAAKELVEDIYGVPVSNQVLKYKRQTLNNRQRLSPYDGEILSVSSKEQYREMRDYDADLTAQEAGDISHIVRTLANKSLIKLWAEKGSLDRRGKRIDHVHPLRFLMHIFTDEMLAKDVRKIKKRDWVWKRFMKGLKGSLEEEYERNNLTDAQINDFAFIVGIDPDVLRYYIISGKWNKLVSVLISNTTKD